MVSLFTSVRLLRLKQYEYNHTTDVDCINITEKYSCTQGLYTEAKTEYVQSKFSKSEKQIKLQKNVQCLDKLFRSYKCLYMSWDLHRPLCLFFSNGTIVNMLLNEEKNMLSKIEIDENLCGKFLQSRIVDVLVCKNYIFAVYVEPKLSIIHINQDSPTLFAKVFRKKRGKIVGFEPKFINFDLSVHTPKPAERRLSLNTKKDLLLVWWKNSGDDVWPWTPVTYLTDRINLFVYSVNGSLLQLLYPIKLKNELIYATFSSENAYRFFSLEETREDGEIVVYICVYEVSENQCNIVHTDKLPVSGTLTAFNWSPTEDKLLASDSKGLLIIYDARTFESIVNVFNLKYEPMHIVWHPQTCIALIIGRNNHIYCIDSALNHIDFKLCYRTNSQLNSLDLTSLFSTKFFIHKVLWQKSSFNNTCLLFLDPEMSSFILLKFTFGTLTDYHVTPLEIVSQYLKCDKLDDAKLIYLNLDWYNTSDIKFQCLSKMVNFLLRKPLTCKTQSVLEFILGDFYKFIDHIPNDIVKVYEPKIYHLSRRFFHHLLRSNEFKKAWMLAVELDSQDLFLDLYHIAKQKEENVLAAVALRKAQDYSSSGSDSSSESCQSTEHSECSPSPVHEYEKLKSKKGEWKEMYDKLMESERYKNFEFQTDEINAGDNGLKHSCTTVDEDLESKLLLTQDSRFSSETFNAKLKASERSALFHNVENQSTYSSNKSSFDFLSKMQTNTDANNDKLNFSIKSPTSLSDYSKISRDSNWKESDKKICNDRLDSQIVEDITSEVNEMDSLCVSSDSDKDMISSYPHMFTPFSDASYNYSRTWSKETSKNVFPHNVSNKNHESSNMVAHFGIAPDSRQNSSLKLNTCYFAGSSKYAGSFLSTDKSDKTVSHLTHSEFSEEDFKNEKSVINKNKNATLKNSNSDHSTMDSLKHSVRLLYEKTSKYSGQTWDEGTQGSSCLNKNTLKRLPQNNKAENLKLLCDFENIHCYTPNSSSYSNAFQNQSFSETDIPNNKVFHTDSNCDTICDSSVRNQLLHPVNSDEICRATESQSTCSSSRTNDRETNKNVISNVFLYQTKAKNYNQLKEYILNSPKEPYTGSDSCFSSSICDIQNSSPLKSAETSMIEDESEEVEGTKIKLAHLGII